MEKAQKEAKVIQNKNSADKVPANLNEDPSDNIQEDESEQESIESTFDAKAPVEDKKPKDRNPENVQKESDESTEAPVKKEKTRSPETLKVDVDVVYKPVVKEPEKSALEVHEQKAIPVNETVDNDDTPLNGSHYVKNVAFDNQPLALSSFQEDLEVTRKILTLNGFHFKTKKSSGINSVEDETGVDDTFVEKHEVPTDDSTRPNDSLPADPAVKTFDYEPMNEDNESEVDVEKEKPKQIVAAQQCRNTCLYRCPVHACKCTIPCIINSF